MRAFVHDEKMPKARSAYADFLTLCMNFGLVQKNAKEQALSNMKMREWAVPEDMLTNTKLYKAFKSSSKSSKWQYFGKTHEEWRAMTVMHTFIPVGLHIIHNVWHTGDEDKIESARYAFWVFLQRMLPGEAGQALISNKFFNPLNHRYEDWALGRLYFEWSTFYTGEHEQILTDLMRLLIAVYVASYVSEEYAQKIFSYCIHVIKTTPVNNMTVNKAVMHAISDILEPEGDGDFPISSMRTKTLQQLNIKGIRYPSYERLRVCGDWSLKETFRYGWSLEDFMDTDKDIRFKDIFTDDRMYKSRDKKKTSEAIKGCWFGFHEDMAFINGSLAAYERIAYKRPQLSVKEKQIKAEYEKKFSQMNNRLTESSKNNLEMKRSLSKAQKRMQELEEKVIEKDKLLDESDFSAFKQRIAELEKANAALNRQLTGAKSKISSLEARSIRERELEHRIKQLEAECADYQELSAVEVDEEIDSTALTTEELNRLRGIRAHLILPDLPATVKLQKLMSASKFTINGLDHNPCLDFPKNMDLYVFCTKMARHADFDAWKARTKGFEDLRVYCPYTGYTAVGRFILRRYDEIQHEKAKNK